MYLQSSACNNDFQVCILTIHIFLSQHLSMLNYFLNFPQHVQKGTVSLENMYYMVAGKKINIYVLNTYIQELIKNICWILVTFKILPAKISNLLSCPWTLQLISKPDFKWCILNKIFLCPNGMNCFLKEHSHFHEPAFSIDIFVEVTKI